MAADSGSAPDRQESAWSRLAEALAINPYYRNDTLAAAAWKEIAVVHTDVMALLEDHRIPAGRRRVLVALLNEAFRYTPVLPCPLPSDDALIRWSDRVMRSEVNPELEWQFAISDAWHRRLMIADTRFGNQLVHYLIRILPGAPELIQSRILILLGMRYVGQLSLPLVDTDLLRRLLGNPVVAPSAMHLIAKLPDVAAALDHELLDLFSRPAGINLLPHLQLFTDHYPVPVITRLALGWTEAIYPEYRSCLLALMSDPRYETLRAALFDQLPHWYRDFPMLRRSYWHLAVRYPAPDLLAIIGLEDALRDQDFPVYLTRVKVPETLPFLLDSFRRDYQMIARGDGGEEIISALQLYTYDEIRAKANWSEDEWETYRQVTNRQ